MNFSNIQQEFFKNALKDNISKSDQENAQKRPQITGLESFEIDNTKILNKKYEVLSPLTKQKKTSNFISLKEKLKCLNSSKTNINLENDYILLKNENLAQLKSNLEEISLKNNIRKKSEIFGSLTKVEFEKENSSISKYGLPLKRFNRLNIRGQNKNNQSLDHNNIFSSPHIFPKEKQQKRNFDQINSKFDEMTTTLRKPKNDQENKYFKSPEKLKKYLKMETFDNNFLEKLCLKNEQIDGDKISDFFKNFDLNQRDIFKIKTFISNFISGLSVQIEENMNHIKFIEDENIELKKNITDYSICVQKLKLEMHVLRKNCIKSDEKSINTLILQKNLQDEKIVDQKYSKSLEKKVNTFNLLNNNQLIEENLHKSLKHQQKDHFSNKSQMEEKLKTYFEELKKNFKKNIELDNKMPKMMINLNKFENQSNFRSFDNEIIKIEKNVSKKMRPEKLLKNDNKSISEDSCKLFNFLTLEDNSYSKAIYENTIDFLKQKLEKVELDLLKSENEKNELTKNNNHILIFNDQNRLKNDRNEDNCQKSAEIKKEDVEKNKNISQSNSTINIYENEDIKTNLHEFKIKLAILQRTKADLLKEYQQISSEMEEKNLFCDHLQMTNLYLAGENFLLKTELSRLN